MVLVITLEHQEEYPHQSYGGPPPRVLQEMDRENKGDANNLDDYLMEFSGRPTTWAFAHPLFKLPVVKYYTFTIIDTTAAMVEKHLTISGAIL
jgi:hypothetical protein